MTREELLAYLRARHGAYDKEVAHIEADEALLAFIGDDEITQAFNAIAKWYA